MSATIPKEPEFSIKDVRNAIPPHCFQRSYSKSFCWLAHDLTLVAITFYLATFIPSVPFITLRSALWLSYWYVQGAFMTGLWVLAHECGHHGFSPSKKLNNAVGFVLHTALLVPYFAWQYTHGQHHSRTNHLEQDTVHVPRMKYAKSKTENAKLGPMKSRSILTRIKRIFSLTVLGWPLYLLFDVTGPPSHDEISWVSHFNPYCSYFSHKMSYFIMLSDVALILFLWLLFKVYAVIGAANLICFYGVPYLVVNYWLVTITFLQHTDWNIDRYSPKEWSWIRGAFCTIDRDYGAFLNYCHHHIADTHVVHHLFSNMPHYNAVEATNALVESGLVDRYYLSSKEPYYVSLWKIIGEGRWQKKNEDVLELSH